MVCLSPDSQVSSYIFWGEQLRRLCIYPSYPLNRIRGTRDSFGPLFCSGQKGVLANVEAWIRFTGPNPGSGKQHQIKQRSCPTRANSNNLKSDFDEQGQVLVSTVKHRRQWIQISKVRGSRHQNRKKATKPSG